MNELMQHCAFLLNVATRFERQLTETEVHILNNARRYFEQLDKMDRASFLVAMEEN